MHRHNYNIDYARRSARGRLARLLLIGTMLNQAEIASSMTADVWSRDSGPIDPSHYAGESLANGAIGLTATAVPFKTEETVIEGANDRMWPGSVSARLHSFNFLNLKMSVDGESIEGSTSSSHFHQSIDFKRAVLIGVFEVPGKARVTYSIRALRQRPQTAVMDVTVEARRPIQIEVVSELAEPVVQGVIAGRSHPPFAWLNEIRQSGAVIPLADAPNRSVVLAAAEGKSPAGAIRIAASQGFVFDSQQPDPPAVLAQKGGLKFRRAVGSSMSSAPFHFALVGSTLASTEVSDPLNEAQRLTLAALIEGSSHLIEQHEVAWSALWASDIVLEGDAETQRDIHSMLYHLYSFIRAGSGHSLSPMGLSGSRNDYLGHVFWDAETWMFPALLVLHPELARSILDYRFDRLSAARANADRNGYRGAQFPWESAARGEEDTWVDAPTGPLEVHISADVALAAWNYFRVTQNRAWLRERGLPLIRETADFWVSRVSQRQARAHIEHTVGADEYAQDVADDAYTNAAAKANLQAAIDASRVLGLDPDPQWEQVRSQIPILKFVDGVTREHSTYTGQTIKQADVNLLAYPLVEIVDPEQIRADLNYYSGRVDEALGPAMTKSIIAVLYERLGEPETAYRWFKAGYGPNLRAPFGVLAESPTSQNPYFATGAGGLLQAMVFGFAGFDITDTGLVQRPTRLPHQWKSLQITGVGASRRTLAIQ